MSVFLQFDAAAGLVDRICRYFNNFNLVFNPEIKLALKTEPRLSNQH